MKASDFSFLVPFALAAFWGGQMLGQEIQSGQGFPLNFDIGYGIMTNEGSTLSQTWMVVTDPNLPVSFDVSAYKGLEIVNVDRGWQYRATFKLDVKQPISAVKVVVIPFDVWNQSLRPLALSHISDLAQGPKAIEGVWNAYDESAALSVLTTIAYVEEVRLQDGSILMADTDFVLDQARKLSSGLELSDITPSQPKSE